ncbi:MAG: hypothetical protein HWE16_08705 [Gammaproteobacteria bacterium]|nr:hypothetical protein [Gammaproteobacteria bacterium]
MLRLLIFLGLSLMMIACQQSYQLSGERYATIHFKVPAKEAPKRILNVELYHIDECSRGEPLTRDHSSYQGRLLYHEQVESSAIQQSVKVAVDQPVTLSASLSQIYGPEKSEICYTQFHQFMPYPGATFEVLIDEYCEVQIMELTDDQTVNNRITQNPTMRNCI